MKKKSLTRKYWLALIFLFLAAGLITTNAFAADLTAVFKNEINKYINDLLSSGSQIYQFGLMMISFFAFIALFFEAVKFMGKGFDYESHFETFIMIVFTVMLWASYSAVVDAVWEAANGIGIELQYVATGSKDPWFLSKWTASVMTATLTPEVGFFSSINVVFAAFLWELIALLLQFAMYVASMWATWGIGLAKIIGVLFIPFLILPQTRSIFDGWVKFIFGFFVLLIIIKVTGVIGAMTMQASLKTLGMTCSGELVCAISNWSTKIDLEASSSTDLIIAMLITIVLVFSSFAFAERLAGSMGGPSKGAANGAKQIAKKIASKLL